MNSNYNEIIKPTYVGDKKLSLALMLTFVILMIQYFILVSFNIIDTDSGNKVQILSKLIVGIIFIYALPIAIKRNKMKFIITYIISIIIFLINYLIFNENREYIEALIFPFFFTCLPSFIYSHSIYDWNVFKNTMKKSSNIIFLFGVLISAMVLLGNTSIGAYSMSLSYYILIPTIVYLDELIDNFTFKKFFYILILIIISLALGSRGPILCIIIFVILKFSKKDKVLNKRNIVRWFLITTLLIFLLINYRSILNLLNEFLIKIGISSRSIRLFLENEIHLSGRENIYNDILIEIYKNPVFGLGLAGDRVIEEGSYAHNLFLELISNFGIVIGSIVIFILLALTIKSFMIKSKDKYDMIIIWFSLGFVDLFVSGSYLIDLKFWIFMGFLLKIFSIKNQKVIK